MGTEQSADVLRVLIVDDEPLARRGVEDLLAGDARFTVVGRCDGGANAVESIAQLKPSLVFLDVQMPEKSGFDVLAELGEDMPATVIVTAFDEHAVRAFDHHVVDYLLKPIDPERFRQTLDRAAKNSQLRKSYRELERVRPLLAEVDGEAASSSRITLRTYTGIVYLEPEELSWVKAAGDYIKAHVSGREYLARETLCRLEKQLEGGHFLRIHRSHIVNRSHVREILPTGNGTDVVAVLRDGVRLPIGRKYKTSTMKALLDQRS